MRKMSFLHEGSNDPKGQTDHKELEMQKSVYTLTTEDKLFDTLLRSK